MGSKSIAYSILAALILSLICATLLFAFPDVGRTVVLTLTAFFAGVIISSVMIKGNAIPVLGHLFQDHWKLFVTFYISIIFSAVVGGLISELILNQLLISYSFKDFIFDFGLSFVFSFLVLMYFFIFEHN